MNWKTNKQVLVFEDEAYIFNKKKLNNFYYECIRFDDNIYRWEEN